MKKYIFIVFILFLGISKSYGCYSFNPIFFDTGSTKLNSEAYKTIKFWAFLLKKDPELLLEIRGNCDSLECDSRDTMLSYRRALVVKEALIKEMGADYCDKNIMSIEAAGVSKPVAFNTTEEGRRLNRRVELLIISKKNLEKEGVITYSDSMSVNLDETKLNSIFSEIASLKKGDNRRIIKLWIGNRFKQLLHAYTGVSTGEYYCIKRKSTRHLCKTARQIAKKRKKQLQKYFSKFPQKITIQYKILPSSTTNDLRYEIYKLPCKI